MMWLKFDENGKPEGRFLQALLLSHRPVRKPAPGLRLQVIRYARKMGLDMIQGDHEDAPGQLELNWMYRRRAAQRRPSDHLPSDLCAGRP